MNYVVVFGQDFCDIYVGRPSKYGNPYQIGIDGSREEVLLMYEGWLYRHPSLIIEIRRELKDKILGCHCYPRQCHAQILVAIANDWQLCMPLE